MATPAFRPGLLSTSVSDPNIVRANKILEAARQPVEVPRPRQGDFPGLASAAHVLRAQRESTLSVLHRRLVEGGSAIAAAIDYKSLYEITAAHASRVLDARPREKGR